MADHRASYSPQDDKLRLFFAYRIPKAEWDALRAAGWTWTMKQASDMCAPWTPEREDVALELCGTIEDEDETREDRSADRAERFTGYLERREDEAESLADRYDGSPRVHAAQDETRAQRAAARHDRIGARAVSKWETAEYWAERTRGVIAHALYLEEPGVRHRRIKGIESEIRGLNERSEKARRERAAWCKVAVMSDIAQQDRAALALANDAGGWWEFQHPTNPERRKASLWDLLREDQAPAARITGAQAAALYLARYGDPDAPDSPGVRWLAHLRLRLAYEVQMLAAQGGTLADAVEMIPGGFVGAYQVAKVSKDAAGRVSRVYFLAPTTSRYDRKGKAYDETNPPPMVLHNIRAEKLAPGSYRAPTDQELAAFKAANKERAKGKPKAPPLLNPDDESAARIQAAWNAARLAGWTARHGENARYYTAPKASAIAPMTQATYSANSGGTYSPAETVEVRTDGTIRLRSNMWTREEHEADKVPVLCRLRVVSRGNDGGAPRVIVLTDKPRDSVPEFVAQVVAEAVAS